MMKGLLIILALAATVYCDDLKDAETYLTYFGYHNPHTFHEANVTESLMRFQKTFGLKVTGKVDNATVNLMNTPRCGNHDNSRIAYYDTPWRKKALSYYYYNYSPDLSRNDIRATVAAALKLWSDVTPLTFTERNGGDINIAFGPYTHRDSRGTCRDPFDGPSKVLAHAYFPPIGRIHFDESETWTVRSRRGINLMWVATHEMGHILGLEHDQQNRDAIMYPYYREYTPNMRLHANDIRRIQRLYGKGGSGGGGGTGGGGTGGGGSCDNKNARCEEWAKRGECGKHSGWMYDNCCKACKDFGSGGGGGGCQDKNSNCRRWAQQGYCRGSHGRWMKDNCCKSCGYSG